MGAKKVEPLGIIGLKPQSTKANSRIVWLLCSVFLFLFSCKPNFTISAKIVFYPVGGGFVEF